MVTLYADVFAGDAHGGFELDEPVAAEVDRLFTELVLPYRTALAHVCAGLAPAEGAAAGLESELLNSGSAPNSTVMQQVKQLASAGDSDRDMSCAAAFVSAGLGIHSERVKRYGRLFGARTGEGADALRFVKKQDFARGSNTSADFFREKADKDVIERLLAFGTVEDLKETDREVVDVLNEYLEHWEKTENSFPNVVNINTHIQQVAFGVNTRPRLGAGGRFATGVLWQDFDSAEEAHAELKSKFAKDGYAVHRPWMLLHQPLTPPPFTGTGPARCSRWETGACVRRTARCPS
jgi:hypothetical protein